MGAFSSKSKQRPKTEQEDAETFKETAESAHMALPVPPVADRSDGRPRLVLLGTTGAGKSTTGNLLLGKECFKVVHGSSSGPVKIKTFSNNDWFVVDTPGMGDVPKPKDMSPEQYKIFCKKRREELFINVTSELRQHGGLILYVLDATRLVDLKQDHVTAIKEVLSGCFTSSVVLLLTKVPRAKYIEAVVKEENLLVGSSVSDPTDLSAQCFYAWLKKERRLVEGMCNLRFAEVLGVGLPEDFPTNHPAHPQHLPDAVRALIRGVGNQPPLVGLAPGVALDWNALVHDRLKAADFLSTTNSAIANTQLTISKQEAARDKLKVQLDAIGKASLGGKLTATAGGAAGAAGALFPLAAPMLALVGGGMAVAGGLTVMSTALAAWIVEQQLASIAANLEELREELSKQRDNLKDYEGMTTEQLRQRVEEIKRLVLGD